MDEDVKSFHVNFTFIQQDRVLIVMQLQLVCIYPFFRFRHGLCSLWTSVFI